MRRLACSVALSWIGLFTLAVAGCGPKTDPTEATSAASKTDSTANPTLARPAESAPEPIKVAPHELDRTRHIVPAAPLAGILDGAPFSPKVLIEGDYLLFQILNADTSLPEREIRLRIGTAANPHAFENKKLQIGQEMPVGPTVPEILVRSANGNLSLYQNGYALTLELNNRVNWSIPGKIYLCLPDEKKTVLAGIFQASFPRQPTEPPGPEDLPLIAGSVKVIGAAPESRLRIGYATHPSAEIYSLGSADIKLGGPIDQLNWTRSEDKPHATTLIAGDGKDMPSRYEHSRLTPGRYLVYAMLMPNGPADWKWVDVVPGQTQTIDLTIDATKTGGVEIVAPIEAVKTVQLVPADEPGAAPLDTPMFTSCAWQLGLEQPIITRKAVFKNLAPGRYEVRASGHSRIVEIVAGKTMELDYDKTLPPLGKPNEGK